MVLINFSFTHFLQRAFLALCLVLSACSNVKVREWEIQTNITKSPCYNSGRLLLNPENGCPYLELEIVRSASGLKAYVNILFLKALPLLDDPERTEMVICFENAEPWVIYPYIFAGGQRLLIPSEAADCLIQTLQEGHSFTIKIGRYQTTIVSTAFTKVYKELMKLPVAQTI